MTVIYVLAAAIIILIIGTYLRKYLSSFQKEDEEIKDEETIAKEEVEAMLEKQKIEEKKDKKDD